MTDDEQRIGNERLLKSFMDAIGDADFRKLSAICTSDFVAELPYDNPPRRLEGFDAYCAAVEPSLEVFRFTLALDRIHPALDPDLLVAEYTSDGIAVPTGRPYRNVYVGLFRFRDGRLASLREFFNPQIAAEALTPNEA